MTAHPTLADAGVSAREAEVLALVGQHLTNVEIGSRLYISVRTVESHVSSLLRKLDAPDRRTLAELAGPIAVVDGVRGSSAPPVLPSPLTSFVGRVAERAALVAALGEHRLVTALGPGGVGKTRLAQAVAADVARQVADGAWYVDLVPVGDGAMVAPAIGAALGLGEQLGRSSEETVIGRLAGSEALLVLDNCEHVIDGVARFVERLLSACPRVAVLATSRARLVVPFEWVFPVPGLSLPDDDGMGDAVVLFAQRAAAVGHAATIGDEWDRIASICRALDGMALAIELAAARLPTLGLDGLEAGLADPLRLLAGGARLDQRHRSLRDMLDWSYALLDPLDQAVLRRVSVFAAPFAPDDATIVAAAPPVDPADVTGALARLADNSLLVVLRAPGGTRYRTLETIRQYGAEQLGDTGESDDVHGRHLDWCLGTARHLKTGQAGDLGPWRSAFDAAADDVRSALTWVAGQTSRRADAHTLAALFADLLFTRGIPGEAQRRYEQAADLADDDATMAHDLRLAAGSAEGRHFGNDALRLYRDAATAARRAGDGPGAAVDLARTAELIASAPGLMAELAPPGSFEALLTEARALAGDNERAHTAIMTAEAFIVGDGDRRGIDLAERAAEQARRLGEPVLESAALDALTSNQLAAGDIVAAVANARRRVDNLEHVPLDARSILEFADAYAMAAGTSIGFGDLSAARRYAERMVDMPCHREEGHLAMARLLVVDALIGDCDRVLAASARFREGWERAGRPVAGNLGMGAHAVAMVHGLRDDDRSRNEWLAILAALRISLEGASRPAAYRPVFETILHLHRGRIAEAVREVEVEPEQLRDWQTGMWRHWYTALWAETAVLADRPDTADCLVRARSIVAGNPVATAMVDRAVALRAADAAGLHRAASALQEAGCRYQWARTLVLAGAEDRARGQAACSAMGLAPMVLRSEER